MAKEKQILRLKYIENFLRTKGERGATFEEIVRKFEDHDAFLVSKKEHSKGIKTR